MAHKDDEDVSQEAMPKEHSEIIYGIESTKDKLRKEYDSLSVHRKGAWYMEILW